MRLYSKAMTWSPLVNAVIRSRAAARRAARYGDGFYSLTPIVNADLSKIDSVREIKGLILLLREECDKVGRKFDGFAVTNSAAPNTAVSSAVRLLTSAERPLIILGKGAAYAQADDDIRKWIETTGIRFLQMSMAKGPLPDSHPQSAAAARWFVLRQADVAMLIGARLNWLLAHGKGPQ
jgi:hypothetical protein